MTPPVGTVGTCHKVKYTVSTTGDKANEVAQWLCGVYEPNPNGMMHHGRKVYQQKAHGRRVYLYWWDGISDYTGWWFGNHVGSMFVYAGCLTQSETPPEKGWTVFLSPVATLAQAPASAASPIRVTQTVITFEGKFKAFECCLKEAYDAWRNAEPHSSTAARWTCVGCGDIFPLWQRTNMYCNQCGALPNLCWDCFSSSHNNPDKDHALDI